ncbi:MAG TPA: hypothetical protein VL485_24470 [Ktedonobacteraceae bacterium]|jgi:hypothetical protein|nr:hypothetical protein [Ktedonobacteraceae bacterium]
MKNDRNVNADLVAFDAAQSRSTTDELIFITQLLRSTRTMFHIDELLFWLEGQFVQRLQMQVAQCWAVQLDQFGQQTLNMRSQVYRDPSLPVHIVTNDQVMLLAKRIALSHENSFFQPVDTLFSSYQTILLKRYGLHYCSGCFIQQNILLPPPNSDLAAQCLPVPLRLVLLFFVHHSSSQNTLPLVNAIVEQALRIAKDRHLLHPLYEGPRLLPPPSSQVASLPPLSELVPRRLESQELLRSSNPLSGSLAIADKKARYLYKYIDGRLTIDRLASLLHVSLAEILPLLRLLLAQKWIQLYTSDGRQVQSGALR